jgi:hypothetical protein
MCETTIKNEQENAKQERRNGRTVTRREWRNRCRPALTVSRELSPLTSRKKDKETEQKNKKEKNSVATRVCNPGIKLQYLF